VIVVSNTSPITNLDAIGQLSLLNSLFDTIIIPNAVFQELTDLDTPVPGTEAVQPLIPGCQYQFAICNIFRYIGIHGETRYAMYTTTDEHGILNNFAKEPKPYLAEKPSHKQQRRYVLQGVAAMLLMGGLLAITAVVS